MEAGYHARFTIKVLNFVSPGLKPKMKDHYRSQKMALWLNLVPDLQKAAAQSASGPANSIARQTGVDSHHDSRADDEKAMLEYRLYSELLPFVPNLKNIDKDAVSSGSTPASSEVLDQVGF